MKKYVGIVFWFFISVITVSAVPFDLPWQQEDAEQFINVETHFVFASANGEVSRTMVYGTKEFDAGDYFIPKFKTNESVSLFIEMQTSILESGRGYLWGLIKGVRHSEKNPEREIAVEVIIEKSKNIKVTQTGGISNISNKEDINGTSRYYFYIKNNNELHPRVTFEFTPAEAGRAKISIIYGTSDAKIVDKTCDVFQTVTFEN